MDANGDFQYSKTLYLEREGASEITIFPNPVFDVLTIQVKEMRPPFAVKIYDALGRIWLLQSFDSPEIKIDTKVLAKGQYFVDIKNKEQVEVKKIVKE
jgi:hypothetical protein